MAINKVVNHGSKSHSGMKNVIGYVLRDDKVREGYVRITGPYSEEAITATSVYKSFLDEKRLWGKDSGRMYAHNVISFHRDEKITPAECLEIGETFADRFFPDHQSLVGVHQDKDHLHCHIVTNSVSYINGKKLHQSKLDLERQKQYTNTLCRERGLSVAEKGRHFDGTVIEDGEIRSWDKDKYNLLIDKAKGSYVADCAIAVLETIPQSTSREEFIQGMEERGWTVQWKDNRKHIVFMDKKGRKVRDSNLSKTFSMDVGKETLNAQFARQAADKEQRTRDIDAAVAGASAALKDARIAVRDSQSERRALRDAETQSDTHSRKSEARARERQSQTRTYYSGSAADGGRTDYKRSGGRDR